MSSLVKVYSHHRRQEFIKFYNTPYTTHQYSLRKVKRRLENSTCKWNYFITLTYAPKFLNQARPEHVKKMFNVLKQGLRNKIRMYKNGGRKKGKNGKYIRNLDGTIRIHKPRPNMVKKYQYYLDNLVHFWKAEFDSTGLREYNPHFHCLIRSDKSLNKKLIEAVWDYGWITIKKIKSLKKAREYVKKYVKKETNYKYWAGKRLFAHSRNLTIKEYKAWNYLGILSLQDFYDLRDCEPIIDFNIFNRLVKKARSQKHLLFSG